MGNTFVNFRNRFTERLKFEGKKYNRISELHASVFAKHLQSQRQNNDENREKKTAKHKRITTMGLIHISFV